MLDFYSPRSSNVIYSPPQVDVSAELTPASATQASKLIVTIALQPLVASFRVAQMTRWVDLFAQVTVGVAAEESSSGFSLTLTVPQADLLVLADEGTPAQVWSDLQFALDLQRCLDQWTPLPHGRSSPFSSHLVPAQAMGGYRFHFEALQLAMLSGGADGLGVTSQSLEMAEGTLSVFVADGSDQPQHCRYLQSLVIRATSDVEGVHKVKISKNEAPPQKKGAHQSHRELASDASRTTQGRRTALDGDTSGIPSSSSSSSDEGGFLLVAESEDDEEEAGRGGDAHNGRHAGSHAGGRPQQSDDQLGPAAPVVPAANVIHITAYQIEIGEKFFFLQFKSF
jgi:hypothetical protein